MVSVLGDENPWLLPGALEILQSKSQLPLDVAASQGWRIESENRLTDETMLKPHSIICFEDPPMTS